MTSYLAEAMSNIHRKGAFDPCALRRLVHPPSDLEHLIENIATHVARNGPAVEYQLRSGSDGQRQYPFLYLDHEFNPFYQFRLARARERHRVAPNTTKETGNCSTGAGKTLDQSSRSTEPDFFDITDYVRLDFSEHNRDSGQSPSSDTSNRPSNTTTNDQRIGDNKHYCPSLKVKSSNISQIDSNVIDSAQQHHQTLEQPQNSSYTQDQPTITRVDLTVGQAPTPRSENQEEVQGIVPYGILQEVHILDTAGTERVGLNTFVIVERIGEEVKDPLMHTLYHSPKPIIDHEPIYHLRPVISVNYRTVHHRLLPVGLELGAEVIKLGSDNPSIVVRRTVIHGQRVYDVKDTQGVVHKNILEIDLQPHSGGCFDFRMPKTASSL